ncbi:MAG: hypothetical protein OEV64_07315 [Desulfobulbaceae bacterium]|nr:hypothetical protein [Desulfobulbaceae bacterium]
MLYVERDGSGKIIGIHNSPTAQAQEPKKILDREVMDFFKSTGVTPDFGPILSEFDQNIIRVLDDLIDLLIKKNVIMFTELPLEAQEKIKWRKLIRKKMSVGNLIVDDIL